jgi:hypothetical protein
VKTLTKDLQLRLAVKTLTLYCRSSGVYIRVLHELLKREGWMEHSLSFAHHTIERSHPTFALLSSIYRSIELGEGL